MKTKEKGHTIIVKRIEESIPGLIQKITDQINTFITHHLIIDLGQHPLSNEEENLFLTLNNTFKTSKKSFVLVAEQADFNALTDEIVVVPTLLEANDIIEMEEIERDLGF